MRPPPGWSRGPSQLTSASCAPGAPSRPPQAFLASSSFQRLETWQASRPSCRRGTGQRDCRLPGPVASEREARGAWAFSPQSHQVLACVPRLPVDVRSRFQEVDCCLGLFSNLVNLVFFSKGP